MNLDTRALVALFTETLGVIAVLMLLGLSPRFKRPPIGFRKPALEGWTALGIFGAALTVSYVIFPWQGVDSWLPVTLADLWPRLTVAVIGAVVVLATLRLRHQPLRSILLGRQTLSASLQMGLAFIFLSIFLRAKLSALVDGVSEETVTALFVWLGLCAAEEMLLRGFLQTRLIPWLGLVPGLLLTALLAVVWQLPFWLPGLTLPKLALYVGVSFAQALLLGWIARRSGHLLGGILLRTISSWLWMV